MGLDLRTAPPWLATVLLAKDDTEESIVGSDLHQDAIAESHAPLFEYAETLGNPETSAWYVSSQVTILVSLPVTERSDPWRPKPDVFVVQGVPARSRTSYDARSEGPMPQFVLEVASDSTWRYDVGEKAVLYGLSGVQEYVVFDPTTEFLREPIRAWHMTPEGWQRWAPRELPSTQRVWASRVLGLALRAEGLLVRFDHPERGPLPVRRELHARIAQEQAARQAAEVQAAAARAARQAAEAQAAAARAARQTAEAQATQAHAALQAAEERALRFEQELQALRAGAERMRPQPPDDQ